MADWLMGTGDLEGGLIGHVFNGYSERHIKPELKQAIERHSLKEAPLTQQAA